MDGEPSGLCHLVIKMIDIEIKNSQEEIAQCLVDCWNTDVRPHVVENACVLAARITSEVFSYFNISHWILPMMAMSMNDKMLDHQIANTPPKDWDKSAWSVGVGFPNMVATNADLRQGEGFEGHLVVVTKNLYIDLTAYQMSRPQHGIDTGGSLLLPVDSIVQPYYLNDAFPYEWGKIPIKEGHLLVTWNGNYSYKDSNDWKKNYKVQSGSIIRTIRNRLASKDYLQYLKAI